MEVDAPPGTVALVGLFREWRGGWVAEGGGGGENGAGGSLGLVLYGSGGSHL